MPELDQDHLLSSYDYSLPEALIAQTPLPVRSDSRLLLLHKESGRIEHRLFADVTKILLPGDLLVLNDTRVTALRLKGEKETCGEVEALLLRETEPRTFEALMRPGRRLKPGSRVRFEHGLAATVEAELPDGGKLITFDPTPELYEALKRLGRVPLPPYITRELEDPERYQTVIARTGGSAAAPTAGLHFTKDLLAQLKSEGVEIATITLDVGIDTFRPVHTETLDDHAMHGERCDVSQETADKIAACQGRVVAVGTTTVRALESQAIGPREVQTGSQVTRIFIRPGYRFQVVDGMFTNFHLPKTTMLVMLAAMVLRDRLMRAYDEAIQQNYRFLSFGDSMLIL